MEELLSEALRRILRETPELKHAHLVGGCVRDWLLGLPAKDIDVEVYGVGYDELAKGLSKWGATDFVGRSFGVVKLRLPDGDTCDFSIPRRDSKVGPGHTGFRLEFDPGISPREAAARRDFTINAIAWDPHSRAILDFFDGQADLRNRVLRHTSPAFPDDPLRVLRGMQFAGRFRLSAAPETVCLCRDIRDGFAELAVERVAEEWLKWAAKSALPSAGLRFLANAGWLEHFPEIAAMRGVPQDPEWHPEGDVFVHTCHCCDALAELPGWQAADLESRAVYMLAVLAHDFAKPTTTREEVRDGRVRIISPGHDEEGAVLAESFLGRLRMPERIVRRVVPLVANHMAHLDAPSDRMVRRLARRLAPETIEGLCLIMTADSYGRPPRPKRAPRGIEALRARATEMRLQDNAPKPILQGRHLIGVGLAPGPSFRVILDEAFEAQLEGSFSDLEGGLTWLHGRLRSGA